MTYFKCGDRVQLKSKGVLGVEFDFDNETGVVVGYATLQSGVPCLILSMDDMDIMGIRHEHLVAPMNQVQTL